MKLILKILLASWSFLRGFGHTVTYKRVQRLMREMRLAGMAPGPATSKKHPQHKVYPCLLRGGGGDAAKSGVVGRPRKNREALFRYR